MVIKMEKKTRKYENLVNWVDASAESFTALKASEQNNMPNKNTTLHTLDGFVKAGLITATKSKEGKIFAKTPEWDVQMAIIANKKRIRAKIQKRKQKAKPAQKPKKTKATKQEAPV